MASKIDISEIQLKQLDNSSLVWITKFAHTLKKHNGTIIYLRGDNVLKQVVNEAKKAHSNELNSIYQQLKSAMRSHLNKRKFVPEKTQHSISEMPPH